MIEFKNIQLSFNEKIILKDFSLHINKGEKILITGKSGKGKSTLLKVLLGFENYQSGEILYNNKKVSDRNINKLRNQYAYVNQDVTLPEGIISEVLSEISNYKYNSFEDEIVIDPKLLSFFELSFDLFSKNVNELSGGERQRLGIILAITLRRPVFLLDEVTSGLDKELKEKVVQYFSDIKETVVVVSHDSEWLHNEQFRKVVL